MEDSSSAVVCQVAAVAEHTPLVVVLEVEIAVVAAVAVGLRFAG